MASRATAMKWLSELTHLPTASGREEAVIDWVRRWAGRRADLRVAADSGGNLLITQKGRKRRPAVFAVAHMDHPAFVITDCQGLTASYDFLGSVNPEYFTGARVNFARGGEKVGGTVVAHDPVTRTGTVRLSRRAPLKSGDIGMWVFPKHQHAPDRFAAPACDDLAGVAASLAALDRSRSRPDLRHFSVLLTRAEEVGLVGAIHAAKTGSVPRDSRVLSVETSRELPDAAIGAGPIIRVGDAMTLFDRDLTNRITNAARKSGVIHQRKLMDGGGCEATAFGIYGYQAAGLCLALGNWHNRGNLKAVESGDGAAVPMLEEISLEDFHGLVDLLVIAAGAVDEVDASMQQLDRSYEESRHLLR